MEKKQKTRQGGYPKMDEAVRGLCQKILQVPINISTLKLYASMQILRRVMEISTWKYSYAAFKSDLSLKNKIDELGKFFRPDLFLRLPTEKIF